VKSLFLAKIQNSLHINEDDEVILAFVCLRARVDSNHILVMLNLLQFSVCADLSAFLYADKLFHAAFYDTTSVKNTFESTH
jgi:hypothetical protein